MVAGVDFGDAEFAQDVRDGVARIEALMSEELGRADELMAEAVTQVTGSTFFGRYGTLDEQVAPILFLASDEASYITGAVLPVAGGDNG